MNKKSTIQDVAKLAGVSKATVSKYLNNIPYVSEETQKKIKSAIDTLQFQPNSLARGLVNKSTKLIGLVVSNYESMINMELIKSVETEAANHHYSVVLFSTNDDIRNEQQLPEIFVNKYQHLDGIILANVRENGVELSQFTSTFEHIVLLHRHIPNSQVDYAVIDGYIGGRLAAEYLVGLGHKRIAMITGPKSIFQFQQRVQGFKDALKEHGLLEQFCILEGGQSVEEGYKAAEKIMLECNSPTAIFAGTDVLALGVLDAARHYGWKIPEDLSVIGFDNIFFSRHARVPLTTIDARIKDLGEQAVRMLIGRIQGTKDEVSKIELRPTLVVRESCSPIKTI
ncbi:LacI family DNA-binding transcriptional regulator [Shouchella clausii]|uniref:LacI family DNA-binding transcriptional regulator n=1 Tax=Shouchella clausii TaxID=79880 RepID=UPI003983734D